MHEPMPHAPVLARQRALRAALAVSFAGSACASRASEPEPAPLAPAVPAEADEADESPIEIRGPIEVDRRVEDDGPTLLLPPVTPPEGSGTRAPDPLEVLDCGVEANGVCPEHCDRNTDIDCCEGAMAPAAGLCHFVPQYGCQCAVIGPFNPPELP
jgi:hypothetical protein